jgi:hypothetical protein
VVEVKASKGVEQMLEAINITSALKCSISVGGSALGVVKIPANCGVAGIDGDSFETDQSFITLSGSSFGPESDNCSNRHLRLMLQFHSNFSRQYRALGEPDERSEWVRFKWVSRNRVLGPRLVRSLGVA